MVNILPAAPHGTTDQMSPDHAAVPLLKAAGLLEDDWPAGGLHGGNLVFFEPNLETWLRQHWPDWEVARQQLIDDEVGYADKHARTYFNAATDAASDPPAGLRLVLQTVIAKVASA